MPVNNSPNMNLPIPVVGQEAGPQYAVDVDNSLTIIDQHNHSPGQGVLITPSGLDINIDLSFNGNSAAALFACKFTPQSSTQPSSLTSALYTVINPTYGSDLYFNDGNGGAIPVVLNGVVAGTPGSISGLVAPASATYMSVSGTFTWQSAANTPAAMDSGPITVRDLSLNSYGVTFQPNPSISGNYQITLPVSLPASQKFVTLDNSGNLLANWEVDGSSIIVSGNMLEVGTLPADSVTSTSIAAGAVLDSNLAATEYAITPYGSSGTTGLVTIATAIVSNPSGRPVMFGCGPMQGYIPGNVGGQTLYATLFILRGATIVREDQILLGGQSGSAALYVQVPSYSSIDAGSGSGTITYTLQAGASSGTTISWPSSYFYAFVIK